MSGEQQVVEQLLSAYCETGNLEREDAVAICQQDGTLDQFEALEASGAIKFEHGHLVELPEDEQG